jgi:hypothetical protein
MAISNCPNDVDLGIGRAPKTFYSKFDPLVEFFALAFESVSSFGEV